MQKVESVRGVDRATRAILEEVFEGSDERRFKQKCRETALRAAVGLFSVGVFGLGILVGRLGG